MYVYGGDPRYKGDPYQIAKAGFPVFASKQSNTRWGVYGPGSEKRPTSSQNTET